ncbi:MAG TPA: histone deacetylase [Acidimicrobiia bacterium]|nr:histone deacetylase [Acidimicrobiia bacterium]
MPTLLYSHASMLEHDTGVGHPERSARLEAVLRGARRVPGVVERQAPFVDRSDLHLVHEASYVAAIERFCAEGGGHADPDTVASTGSWEAALRAAGSGVAAIDAIDAQEARDAFLAVRPPGHHALAAGAMGFCFFNNAAVAAARLRRDGRRVAIIDWDVHHGNGTQDMFYEDDGVLYVSLHQSPFYPGTGSVSEVGIGEAAGTTVNIPLPAGTDGAGYATAWGRIVGPVLDEFSPDGLIVSAGYDAHRDDPLAGMLLEAADYGWMAFRLSRRDLPTLVFLEGGYDLIALEDSVEATLLGLDDTAFTPATTGAPIPEAAIDRAAAAASVRWETVQGP